MIPMIDRLLQNAYIPTGKVYSKTLNTTTTAAAAIEALSEALPKNGRYNDPRLGEQGVIELGPGQFTLEKTLNIVLTGANVSKYGLTIRGQGSGATILYVPPTASAANFKGVDGVWRAIRIAADAAGKMQKVRLEGFSVVNYMTQNGDGTTKLTDPMVAIDLEYLIESHFEDITVYNRNLAAMSNEQYSFAIRRSYYSSGRDLRSTSFIVSNSANKMNGTLGPRYGGNGFKLEENNAFTLVNPEVAGGNLAFHLYNDQGTAIMGGAYEHMTKGFLFDGSSRSCHIDGVRPEYHVLDGSNGAESLEEYYIAKFTETSQDNIVDVVWNPSNPNVKGWYDLSEKKSNVVNCPSHRRSVQIRNMLTGSWTNSASVTTAASTDAPPGYEYLGSTEITSNGAYNQDRYQTITINPDMGSITARVFMKRISGDGMLAPQVQGAINTPVYAGDVHAAETTWDTITTIPLETTGHSWASTNGGELTLKTSRPHYLQQGMRLTTGGAYGTLASGTNVYVRSIPDAKTLVLGVASDPGTITSPAALTVPADMIKWQGKPNVTSDWQEFISNIAVRAVVVGISLNGSNQPVLTFRGSGYVPRAGFKIKLSGFADSRLNGHTHTVIAGDISGSTLTISNLTAAGLDVTTAAKTGADSSVNVYGYVGITEIRMSLRTVTTSNTSIVWRVTGEYVQAGSRLVMEV